ncbi:MAG: DUF4389 domain-containing protein [Dehalococcoidia bacterium]
MTQAATYPMTYDVEYPPELSRWLIFVKWLLVIPHWIIVSALGMAQGAITLVAWFAILFTGRYPRFLFDFVVNVYRWNANAGAYVYLLRDEYPPFTWEAGQYPVTFDVEYPERLSRWLIFVKWLLIIPHVIVLYFMMLAWFVTTMIAFFAILFTKRYPEGLFRFAVGVERWSNRINVYVNLLRDEYPPFSLAP